VPLDDVLACTAEIARWGDAVLTYGADRGPSPLIDAIAARLTDLDGRPTAADEILITAGASQGLDMACGALAAPGEGVLVEDPTYDLALGIFRDRRLHPYALPRARWSERGALEEVVAAGHAAGRPIRLAYVIPTYHNPTGEVMTADARSALVEVARAHGMVIVEDDVYRELAYDSPPPPPLQATAPDVTVRLGSFAKSVGPGLRTGWITARAERIDSLLECGLLRSGGGIAHVPALIVARFHDGRRFADHVDRLRAAYRARRDALVDALSRDGGECRVATPAGGMFAWLTLPDGVDERHVVKEAFARGVAVAPGTQFYVDGAGRQGALRLAFTCLPREDMAAVAARLGEAVTAAEGKS
jgi:DNA-binding transcriptional MocR family regulator